MRVHQLVSFFEDFYDNFDAEKAYSMISRLGINAGDKLKNMSKGTKEKVQLILTMSRNASLYLLDEPIGAVSYTHLDVYKRQGRDRRQQRLHCPGCRSGPRQQW